MGKTSLSLSFFFLHTINTYLLNFNAMLSKHLKPTETQMTMVDRLQICLDYPFIPDSIIFEM